MTLIILSFMDKPSIQLNTEAHELLTKLANAVNRMVIEGGYPTPRNLTRHGPPASHPHPPFTVALESEYDDLRNARDADLLRAHAMTEGQRDRLTYITSWRDFIDTISGIKYRLAYLIENGPESEEMQTFILNLQSLMEHFADLPPITDIVVDDPTVYIRSVLETIREGGSVHDLPRLEGIYEPPPARRRDEE